MCWVQDGAQWFAGVCKLDVGVGRRAAAWAQIGCHPSEPVFVPRPGGTAEDDGVLLVIVLNGASLWDPTSSSM